MTSSDIYYTILEDWLPTKWSRWVAVLTPMLATGGLLLPNFLNTIDLPLSKEASLLIRISLSLTPLLVGTFLILLLVVRHFALEKKKEILLPVNLLPWKFHDKIILSIGAYHDVLTKKGEKFVRITFKDISQQNMPPPYESPDSTPDEIKTEVASIGFTPGYFVSHGYRVKKISTPPFLNEDCFYMCKKENDEISDSAFLFNTEHKVYEYFFRCYVDHINPAKKEVELDIFFIWLNPIKP